MKQIHVISFLTLFYCLLGFSQMLQARSIFLNGTDISSATNQEMKNVEVKIDAEGNIHMSAPHYQVIEEDQYSPLSRLVEGVNKPAHKMPSAPMEKPLKKDQDKIPEVPADQAFKKDN